MGASTKNEESRVSITAPTYTYRAVVQAVYDGDTVRVDIDLGCKTWLRDEPIRLSGINAPELRGSHRPDGLAAKAWLERKIPPGTQIILETAKDKRGKYGRYLGRIWLSGTDLNAALVAEGLAERYPE